MKTLGVTLMSLMLAGTIASAETVRHQRGQNQQARIRQGVRSGELTPRETVRLQRQQAHIRQETRQEARDGGGLTVPEKARINRMQNRASRNIYRQKHDGQTR